MKDETFGLLIFVVCALLSLVVLAQGCKSLRVVPNDGHKSIPGDIR